MSTRPRRIQIGVEICVGARHLGDALKGNANAYGPSFGLKGSAAQSGWHLGPTKTPPHWVGFSGLGEVWSYASNNKRTNARREAEITEPA
jgi:hypothetical protein